jgi:hypothetical protein
LRGLLAKRLERGAQDSSWSNTMVAASSWIAATDIEEFE